MEQVKTKSVANLPFELAICGLSELPSALKFQPSHVISITDPDDEDVEFPSSLTVLRLAFRDVHSAPAFIQRRAAQDAGLPTIDHAQSILDFGRLLPDGARVLAHCWAGMSRSAAAAYLLACQAMPRAEHAALDLIKSIRPRAQPNRLLVRHGDRLLGAGRRMVQCVDRGRS